MRIVMFRSNALRATYLLKRRLYTFIDEFSTYDYSIVCDVDFTMLESSL